MATGLTGVPTLVNHVTLMSAQQPLPSLRAALRRLALSNVAVEKLEHCDGCRRMFPLRQVELVGSQMLCVDCGPSELGASLHPYLPPHPPLLAHRPRAAR